MRSLLRWTSLGATGVVLYALGVRGFHHREFSLFLGLVLAFAIAIVILFAATSTSSDRVEE